MSAQPAADFADDLAALDALPRIGDVGFKSKAPPRLRELLGGERVPARPARGPLIVRDTAWMDDAACRSVDTATSDAMVEAVTPAQADEFSHLCHPCPVRLRCLEFGRATWAWGCWGGAALAVGYLVAERTAKPTVRQRKRAAQTVAAAEPAPRRRQRVQPRRTTRAQRRGRR